jgi:hypothetical protein
MAQLGNVCLFVRGITVLHDGNVFTVLHGAAQRGVRGGHFSRYSMETDSCAMAVAGATRNASRFHRVWRVHAPPLTRPAAHKGLEPN